MREDLDEVLRLRRGANLRIDQNLSSVTLLVRLVSTVDGTIANYRFKVLTSISFLSLKAMDT